jgi:thiosulfate dehydrogenase
MQKRSIFLIVSVLAFALLIVAACGGRGSEESAPADTPAPTEAPAEQATEQDAPEAEAPAEETQPELIGDSLRGGLLYDKWWPILGVDAPEEDQALWATQDTNTRSGADTWRCKECHGWDYKGADGAYNSGSHATGFSGVVSAAEQGANYILGALIGETNPEHDFSAVMNEQALIDMSLFIADETIDYDEIIGEDKMAVAGDEALGSDLFAETCADCHGPEGIAVNFSNVADPEYVGGLAQGNPWEFAHKMRFGQPGVTDMPSAIDLGWTLEEQAAVLAYAQSLPVASPVTEGGQLYDKWWSAIGADAPEEDQALWATQDTNTRSGADTWRCKECHGWDYKGAEGAYSAGSHTTGFPGILDDSSLDAEELLAWLDGTTNADHDFSDALAEEQLSVLVAFMQGGMTLLSAFINADKSVNGDADNGKILYNAGCKRCHGEDGTAINFGGEDDPEFVGTIAIDNPWEFFHKASFGQPGEHMPAGTNLGWSAQELADLLKYSQSFPTEK